MVHQLTQAPTILFSVLNDPALVVSLVVGIMIIVLLNLSSNDLPMIDDDEEELIICQEILKNKTPKFVLSSTSRCGRRKNKVV